MKNNKNKKNFNKKKVKRYDNLFQEIWCELKTSLRDNTYNYILAPLKFYKYRQDKRLTSFKNEIPIRTVVYHFCLKVVVGALENLTKNKNDIEDK